MLKCKSTVKNRLKLRQKWRAENNPKYRISLKKQQALDINRKWIKNTPNWVNKKAIQEIFINCPENMTVDHIIPINGKNFCGLHVEYNLQYLTRQENSSKNNRLPKEFLNDDY